MWNMFFFFKSVNYLLIVIKHPEMEIGRGKKFSLTLVQGDLDSVCGKT